MNTQDSQPKITWTGGEFRTKCVVGLARDGVVNEYIGGYCYRVEDFKEISGSIDSVAELRRKGYKIVFITDQGGIETKQFTQEQVETVNMHMLELLGKAGCFSIDGIYFSAGVRKEDPFALPNNGMFKKCEKEIKDIKFKEGYYVGHTIKELKAAVSAGARPVLVRTGKGTDTEKELNRYAHKDLKRKTLIFDNLTDFVNSLN